VEGNTMRSYGMAGQQLKMPGNSLLCLPASQLWQAQREAGTKWITLCENTFAA
jgi:hypothetical protein